MTKLIPSENKLVSKLTRDIKYRLADDFGIAYDSREKYIAEQNDEQLLQLLLGNMQKGDRARAVFDFLLDLENRERTDQIIAENRRLSIATIVLAVATVALAIATALMVFKMP